MKRLNIGWGTWILVALCVVGAIFPKEPTSAPTSAVVTPSAVSSITPTAPDATETILLATAPACDETYYNVVVDTVKKLDEAVALSAVDALIERYDATEMPYGCGRNDALLNMTDYSMRIALGERRTALMSDNAEQHAIASKINGNEALKTIVEWRNE
jgi:hypothetical protein